MKATGIVRRVDDLGRIVIPKEVRRTLGINEGDPLEIFVDKDGCLIYRKYLPTLESDIQTLCDKLCNHIESYNKAELIRRKCKELANLVNEV